MRATGTHASENAISLHQETARPVSAHLNDLAHRESPYSGIPKGCMTVAGGKFAPAGAPTGQQTKQITVPEGRMKADGKSAPADAATGNCPQNFSAPRRGA
jgi:hypothetical protein